MSNILLVEKDLQQASHWQKLLTGAGFQVNHATSLESAIAFLKGQPVDLVISDIALENDAVPPSFSGGLALISFIALNLAQSPLILATICEDVKSPDACMLFESNPKSRMIRKSISDANFLLTVQELFARTSQPAGSISTLDNNSSTELRNASNAPSQQSTERSWEWQIETNKVNFSPGFRVLLGFDQTDVASFPNVLESLTERVHAEDLQAFRASIDKSIQSQIPFLHELRIKHKNGNFFWTRCRATPTIDWDGQRSKLIISTSNIAEKVVARSALSNKTIELDHLIDWMPLALIYTDTERRITRVNRSFNELFGYSDEEVIGQKTKMLYATPDAFSLTGKTRFNPEANERKESYEMTYRRKDGSEFDGETIGSNLHDEQGKTVAFVGLIQDISHRKKSEAELKSAFEDVATAEKRFREVADINMPCWITEVDATCSWLNRQWLEYTGLSLEQQLGHGWTNVVHPDDIEGTKATYFEANDNQRDFELEYRLRRKDGEYRLFRARGRVRRAENGDFEGYTGSSIDIHDIRQAQIKLEQINADLVQSNSELEQFAYVASHDLKQPLRGIDHLSEWIFEDSYDRLTESSKEHFKKLKVRVKRLEQLLDDLLAFSRAGRKHFRIVLVNIEEMVADTTDLLAPPKGFTAVYTGPKLKFQASHTELELVLRNLIANSIKHRTSDDGQVKIDATLDGQFINFKVADDGPGIAPKYHDRVFQMFQTLKSRDELEGTGMGLAIVKKIVESKGGSIAVESTEGNGATFKFNWPVAERQIEDVDS